MKPPTIGLSHSEQLWASPADLASALGNTGVDVVSSPATIGYLEMACVRAVSHLFETGEASVGVGFELRHVGAASPTRPVDVCAELTGVDGARLTFRVEASQAGRAIMTGTHQRAVVELARLLRGKDGGGSGEPLLLTGRSLDPAGLEDVATGRRQVVIAEPCRAQMARGRAVVMRYFDENIPAYGLNTGLGVRATQMLSAAEAADFSVRVVRGRSQGVGEPLPPPVVRAAMLARLNTLLGGEAGVSPSVADALAAALNAGFTPVMYQSASIGAGDLVAMAGVAHALMGEGEAWLGGERVAAGKALEAAGLSALVPGPKDGLGLCNITALSAGHAGLCAARADRVLDGLDAAAGLTLEGFRANVSPFRTGATRVRPQAGEVAAGARFMALLEGGLLGTPGAARRLQDPLSIRSLAQVSGAAHAGLRQLGDAVVVELNHAADNPAVMLEEGTLVSTGNYHTPWLAHCLDGAARVLATAASDSVSRVHRLCQPELSGLPPLLSSQATDRAGFGPLLKPLEALRAEIIHLATPVPVLASHNAGGVEDAATLAPLAAQKLDTLIERLALVVAFELVAAAQAVDLAGPERIGTALTGVHAAVRALSGHIGEDRPLGREIEAIAARVLDGSIARAAQA